MLIQHSHSWNAIDNDGVTAGEYAKHNAHEEVYNMLVEEGCRAELILGLFVIIMRCIHVFILCITINNK